jgi:hypothetical protein
MKGKTFIKYLLLFLICCLGCIRTTTLPVDTSTGRINFNFIYNDGYSEYNSSEEKYLTYFNKDTNDACRKSDTVISVQFTEAEIESVYYRALKIDFSSLADTFYHSGAGTTCIDDTTCIIKRPFPYIETMKLNITHDSLTDSIYIYNLQYFNSDEAIAEVIDMGNYIQFILNSKEEVKALPRGMCLLL